LVVVAAVITTAVHPHLGHRVVVAPSPIQQLGVRVQLVHKAIQAVMPALTNLTLLLAVAAVRVAQVATMLQLVQLQQGVMAVLAWPARSPAAVSTMAQVAVAVVTQPVREAQASAVLVLLMV
jgi:hypothetical protein